MPAKGRNKIHIAGLLLALALPIARGAEDTRPLSLEHLTAEDGLPQNTVYDTLQDSQGFVWFATEDGLIRYDGRDLVRYAYSRNDRGGLPGNFIRDIVEDAGGDLWIAIKDGGLARWSRATDRFTSYKHDPANKDSLASNLVRSLLLDARGRLWIAMPDAGIDIYDPRTGRFEHLRHRRGDAESLVDDRVNMLAMDRDGAIWAGTEAGLTRFRHQTGRAEQFRYPNDKVSQFLQDRQGRRWVGFYGGGLARIDGNGALLQRYQHEPGRAKSLAHDDVRAILEDRNGRIWVGTADGLDMLDVARGEFSHYRHSREDPESLADSFVMSLYEDSAGLVWIGTRSGGVSRWNPHSWELGGHRPAWLSGALVTSFADAHDGRIWIGSIGGGLMRFDPESGVAEPLDRVTGKANALGDSRVMSLLSDRRGILWVGTMSNGLKALQPDGRVVTVPVGKGLPNGTSAPGLMTLYEARDGKIWIGTYGGGANVLDPATGAVRQLPFNERGANSLTGANVSAFAEDAEGNLWIATDGGGLNLTRSDGSLIRVFRHDPADPTSLASNTLYALAADGSGRIWIGTDGGGLDQVEGSSNQPDSIRFRNLSRVDGLSSDTVYGILTDARGRLWLSGNAGLMRYDPRSRAIKTFHREHGLQGEEFNFNAYFRSRSGLLLFGGPGGFNAFDPGKLTERSTPPRVALTDLEILGVPAKSKKPWWLTDTIELQADANIISLKFAALDYTSPSRNRLAYRMRGLSDRWIDLGSANRVTLTNLDAGEHRLEVRAANADSIWSTRPVTLTISKAAPLWQSPPAYVLYAALLGGLLAYRAWLQRRRFQSAIDARQRLESEVAHRTQELRESNRLLEEAAQVKEGFLARMSHELRTPMNGVIGMADLLETTHLTPIQRRYTDTIRTSAQALLRILNDLLDLSKINAGRIELETADVDIARLLDESALLFSGSCNRKNLELIVSPPAHAPLLRGDPLRIRQILINLIGNAVKFTQIGSVQVRGNVQADGAQRARVFIEVIDTGIGIESQFLARIFDPFTQADESTARRFGGTGLGLTICRELAQLMGGRIDVRSQPGQGTTFQVELSLALATSSVSSPASTNAPEPATPNAPPTGEPARRARVLVVEDDPINATVAEGYLQQLGCVCVWVTDGPSAFARLGSEPFDLILMDLSMPGMDGFATTSALRHRMAGLHRIPIVALTAHDAESYRERCLAADMDDILSKPYTLAECSAIVRRWLPPNLLADPSQGQPVANNQASLAEIDAATVAGIANLDSPRQRDLYSRLVSLFEQSTATRLGELAAALSANDSAAGAAVCHKLKSAAANVGALAFAGVVKQAEAECHAGNVAGAMAVHRRLEQALPALLEGLRSYKLRISA